MEECTYDFTRKHLPMHTITLSVHLGKCYLMLTILYTGVEGVRVGDKEGVGLLL